MRQGRACADWTRSALALALALAFGAALPGVGGLVPAPPAAAAGRAAAEPPGQAPPDAAARTQRLTAAWAQALGGAEALRGIQSVHQLGVVEGHGVSGDLDEWQTRDGRHRQFIDFQGRWNVLTLFDGVRGWSVDEGGVRHVLRGEDLAGEYTDACLATFAWRLPAAACPLRYGGLDSARGEERLILMPERGLPVTLVFGREGGLPLRFETETGGRTRVIAPLDWRSVDGVLFPFGYRQSTGDIRDDVVTVLREVRLNETPPADAFAAPPGPPPDVTFAEEGRARLDVALALGRIFVPVLVDGRGPFTFLLDTAAPRSTLSEAVAQAGALPVALDTTGVAAGDAPRGGRRFVTAGGLAFGDAAWSGARLDLEPLDGLSQSAGRRVDGRLGVDFLARFVVELEPRAARLTLHDPALFAPEADAFAVPLRLVKGLPTLAVRLDGRVDARLLLRTGMRFPLVLAAGLAPALRLEPDAPGTHAAPLVTPAQGAALFTVGWAQSLDFPGAARAGSPSSRLERVPAAIPPPGEALPLGPELTGLLGGEVLNRFHWWLDLTREELRLDPESLDDDAHFPADAAGLIFRAEAPDFNVFTVDWVMPDGPGARAGLLPGDRLESLDGHLAAELRLERIVLALSRPGETVRLTLNRAGKSRKVVLRLQTLS